MFFCLSSKKLRYRRERMIPKLSFCSLCCHDVDLARIVFIPQIRKNFQFLEATFLVKTVGLIVFLVPSFGHGLNMQKGIMMITSPSFCLFDQQSADPLMLQGFLYAHHNDFEGCAASRRQAQKARRPIRSAGRDHDLRSALPDILFPARLDPEPFRQSFQDRTGNFFLRFRLIGQNDPQNGRSSAQ